MSAANTLKKKHISTQEENENEFEDPSISKNNRLEGSVEYEIDDEDSDSIEGQLTNESAAIIN